MTVKKRPFILSTAIIALTLSICVAQFGPRGGRGGRFGGNGRVGSVVQTEGGMLVDENTVRTARETLPHSMDTPDWEITPGFEHDVYTFARVIFHSTDLRAAWFGWVNDYPDSDLNLSYRLQQLTSVKTDPDGRVLKLTDPELFHYPLIHMAKPGYMVLYENEVEALQKYLAVGGAIFADDFWGDEEWNNFEAQIARILPGKQWVELEMDHPLFSSVFPLKMKKQDLQVPYIQAGLSSLNPNSPNFGNSAQFGGADNQDIHIRAWLDDRERIQIIATHNTNNGDGWEREAENEQYFRTYSETRAYPLAINIIFYIMTH